jgi:hypothetical protein
MQGSFLSSLSTCKARCQGAGRIASQRCQMQANSYQTSPLFRSTSQQKRERYHHLHQAVPQNRMQNTGRDCKAPHCIAQQALVTHTYARRRSGCHMMLLLQLLRHRPGCTPPELDALPLRLLKKLRASLMHDCVPTMGATQPHRYTHSMKGIMPHAAATRLQPQPQRLLPPPLRPPWLHLT